MNSEDPDGLTGGSRPTADDGPFATTVDGETFKVTLRQEEPGACDYDWESGPNEGYGFSSSRHVAFFSVHDKANTPSNALPSPTIDEHRESIRDFLSQINPETGFIGD